MSKININLDILRELSAELKDFERVCEELNGSIKWNYQAASAVYRNLEETYCGSLFRNLVSRMEQYTLLLEQARIIVDKTENDFREEK